MKTVNTILVLRLAQYKARAAKMNEYYPNAVSLHTWQENRYPRPKTIRKYAPNSYGENGQMLLDQPEDFPGNYEGLASDIICLNHTGWYTNDETDIADLAKGAVFSIKTPNGRVYMPGIVYCENTKSGGINSAVVFLKEQHDNQEDAARSADGEAESAAEECREFYEKDGKEQRIEAAKEEIHELNKQALPLIKEIKAAGRNFTPAICQALKGDIASMLRERTELFTEIDNLKTNL
jgi:hypothetical protein